MAGKATTPDANASNNSAKQEDAVLAVFNARMGLTTNVTDERLMATMRGAKVLKASLKDFEKVQVGVPNSGLRAGEYFKVIKPLLIEQMVQNDKRQLAVLIIENAKGEQRPIYASSLMRGTPTRSTEVNQYSDEVINFNRGLLQDTIGFSFPQIFERLVGDGEQFLKVEDTVSWNLKATRTTGEDFTANQTAFRLVHVDAQEAKDAIAE